jgi:hypothetical protein
MGMHPQIGTQGRQQRGPRESWRGLWEYGNLILSIGCAPLCPTYELRLAGYVRRDLKRCHPVPGKYFLRPSCLCGAVCAHSSGTAEFFVPSAADVSGVARQCEFKTKNGRQTRATTHRVRGEEFCGPNYREGRREYSAAFQQRAGITWRSKTNSNMR